MKIDKNLSVGDLAALVCQTLSHFGIEAVLTGGAVVTIYSDNEYQSHDLDFITEARTKEVALALSTIGFAEQKPGRYFVHPGTPLYVEFPAPPLAIGNEPVTNVARQRRATGELLLLTPTQCVMDRLAAYYHWNDQQSLAQVVAVARRHRIQWKEVLRWSRQEGFEARYQAVLYAVRKGRRSR